MGTAIEWSDETWNPVTGCDRVSPGCAHCYALTLAARLKGMGQPRYQKDGGRASGPGFGLTLHPDALEKPFSWRKPRRVFVNSMSDLFHEEIPFEFIDRVFGVMALTPGHTYQVLTKRPERMKRWFQGETSRYYNDLLGEWRTLTERPREDTVEAAIDSLAGEQGWDAPPLNWPLPNVWLGVTAENQRWADERIPMLLDTPAAVRFVSYEPALGPVALYPWLFETPGIGIDWLIVGGESGPKHRPFDRAWARSVVVQCREAGVACFVKQLGGFRPGTALEDLPVDLRVREYPA